MAKNSALIERKSNEFISLLSEFEERKLRNDEKEKIIEIIGRVLVHSNITIDHLVDDK